MKTVTILKTATYMCQVFEARLIRLGKLGLISGTGINKMFKIPGVCFRGNNNSNRKDTKTGRYGFIPSLTIYIHMQN